MYVREQKKYIFRFFLFFKLNENASIVLNLTFETRIWSFSNTVKF